MTSSSKLLQAQTIGTDFKKIYRISDRLFVGLATKAAEFAHQVLVLRHVAPDFGSTELLDEHGRVNHLRHDEVVRDEAATRGTIVCQQSRVWPAWPASALPNFH